MRYVRPSERAMGRIFARLPECGAACVGAPEKRPTLVWTPADKLITYKDNGTSPEDPSHRSVRTGG
jgi:hypothetical protein